MLVLWFCAFTCCWFWWKTFAKRCSNNFYYHVTKQFLPCLILLVTCFRFQIMFWKNIVWFRFWWKTYTKHCISNYVISRFKILHFVVCQVLSIWGYDFENVIWRWKCGFWFCSDFVYFADLKTIYFSSCLYCSCTLFKLHKPL